MSRTTGRCRRAAGRSVGQLGGTDLDPLLTTALYVAADTVDRAVTENAKVGQVVYALQELRAAHAQLTTSRKEADDSDSDPFADLDGWLRTTTVGHPED